MKAKINYELCIAEHAKTNPQVLSGIPNKDKGEGH